MRKYKIISLLYLVLTQIIWSLSTDFRTIGWFSIFFMVVVYLIFSHEISIETRSIAKGILWPFLGFVTHFFLTAIVYVLLGLIVLQFERHGVLKAEVVTNYLSLVSIVIWLMATILATAILATLIKNTTKEPEEEEKENEGENEGEKEEEEKEEEEVSLKD